MTSAAGIGHFDSCDLLGAVGVALFDRLEEIRRPLMLSCERLRDRLGWPRPSARQRQMRACSVSIIDDSVSLPAPWKRMS